MKKIILLVAICVTAFVQQSFSQKTSTPKPSGLLTSYLNIKDALVSADANNAANDAANFVETIKSIGSDIVNESDKKALVEDAAKIAATKNLKRQRAAFSTFSATMYALAKHVKLSTEPVYYLYCPMKNATWLSNSEAIKNPYYDDAMLTCGKVTETIQ